MRPTGQRGVMKNGRRFGGPPKPYVPPEEPVGEGQSDRSGLQAAEASRGYVQGYNAQAVVTEHQIVIAAEITPTRRTSGTSDR